MAKVSQEVKRQLQSEGTALVSVWGGPQKKRYYTPDGREVFAVPALREYVKKDAEGKVVGEGARDANYDRGWLESMPTELKPYCAGCDNWHDTKAEVSQCIKQKASVAKRWEARVNRGRGKKDEGADVRELKAQVAQMQATLEQYMKGNGNGPISQ